CVVVSQVNILAELCARASLDQNLPVEAGEPEVGADGHWTLLPEYRPVRHAKLIGQQLLEQLDAVWLVCAWEEGSDNQRRRVVGGLIGGTEACTVAAEGKH